MAHCIEISYNYYKQHLPTGADKMMVESTIYNYRTSRGEMTIDKEVMRLLDVFDINIPFGYNTLKIRREPQGGFTFIFTYV